MESLQLHVVRSPHLEPSSKQPACSGQCFSSEAWGGRSANRGQCAQACRLPYGLIVDGALKDMHDAKYLLSPQVGPFPVAGVCLLQWWGRPWSGVERGCGRLHTARDSEQTEPEWSQGPVGVVVHVSLCPWHQICSSTTHAYVCSCQDLMAVELVPELVRAGVSCFKIEGRLKGPEYVALTTQVRAMRVMCVHTRALVCASANDRKLGWGCTTVICMAAVCWNCQARCSKSERKSLRGCQRRRYCFASTQVYRRAVDAAWAQITGQAPTPGTPPSFSLTSRDRWDLEQVCSLWEGHQALVGMQTMSKTHNTCS